MQTFLPEPDFALSAAALDDKRLGSQINEVCTILGALHETNENGGYYNHPVTRMWKFYEYQLAKFGLACEDEWEARGFKVRKNRKTLETHLGYAEDGESSREFPYWFGEVELHDRYKTLLISKNPAYYSTKWPRIPFRPDYKFEYPII